MDIERSWTVLLLGGASGVGKTSMSYRLAHHYGVGLTEVDDFQVVLEGMTAPEQYPVLHFWRTHYEEARDMDEDAQLEFMLQYAAVMANALTLVIANHLESNAPVILEGDFILPALAVQTTYAEVSAGDRVKGLFLYEESEEQIARNYLQREGHPQETRARTSRRVSEWIRQQAELVGVPVLTARPWDTVLERAIAVVDGQAGRGQNMPAGDSPSPEQRSRLV